MPMPTYGFGHVLARTVEARVTLSVQHMKYCTGGDIPKHIIYLVYSNVFIYNVWGGRLPRPFLFSLTFTSYVRYTTATVLFVFEIYGRKRCPTEAALLDCRVATFMLTQGCARVMAGGGIFSPPGRRTWLGWVLPERYTTCSYTVRPIQFLIFTKTKRFDTNFL